MCVVSMMGDYFEDKFKKAPWIYPNPGGGSDTPSSPYRINLSGVTKEEFEALKKEVQILSDLLKAALEYDKKNNEPNCEKADKIALLKALAKELGVKLPI